MAVVNYPQFLEIMALNATPVVLKILTASFNSNLLLFPLDGQWGEWTSFPCTTFCGTGARVKLTSQGLMILYKLELECIQKVFVYKLSSFVFIN